jgi:hypothetical protein
MNAVRLIAILAVVAGALGIIYGGFSYTKESTVAKLGPLEVKAEENKRVNIPLWAGIAVLVAGGGVLLLSAKK